MYVHFKHVVYSVKMSSAHIKYFLFKVQICIIQYVIIFICINKFEHNIYILKCLCWQLNSTVAKTYNYTAFFLLIYISIAVFCSVCWTDSTGAVKDGLFCKQAVAHLSPVTCPLFAEWSWVESLDSYVVWRTNDCWLKGTASQRGPQVVWVMVGWLMCIRLFWFLIPSKPLYYRSKTQFTLCRFGWIQMPLYYLPGLMSN